MIRLTEFFNQSSFNIGDNNINLGKVYSDPRVRAFAPEPQITEAEESTDHEVSMAQNSLDSIIKSATELKQKMGEEEKQIPAWIQDHITNSENYISQAASNYHEYGDSNESVVNEASDAELVKNMQKTIEDLMDKLNSTKDSRQRESIKKAININADILNFWKSRMIGDKIKEEEVEEVAKTPSERIQNLNNRIAKLKDKINATKSSEQKMKFQNTLKNALQSLSNIKKDFGIKAPHREEIVNEMGPTDIHLKSIIAMFDKGGDFTKKKVGVAVAKNPRANRNQIMNDLRDMDYDDVIQIEKELGIKEIAEGKYDSELDKIAGAVEKASSFMNVGAELRKIGVKFDFSTSMIPMYRIKLPTNTIAIVNKKYAAGAEKVVGDIAVGLLEGVVNEAFSNVKVDAKVIADRMRKNSSTKAFADKIEKLGKVSASDLDKMLPDFVGGGIITKLFKESINEDFKHLISVDTPTQVVSKPVAAQIEKLAKSGVRSKDIGLKMGFVGNQKLATDEFQKLKNKIYFALHKTESINEDVYDIGSGYMGNGLTIWNRAKEVNGDYPIIAHISPDGKLSVRDPKLPNGLKKMFQIWADSMKKGKMGPQY